MKNYDEIIWITLIGILYLISSRNKIKEVINNIKLEIMSKEAIIKEKVFYKVLNGGDTEGRVYYIEFIIENEVRSYKINKKIYDNVEDGMRGILTFKGSRFIRFETEDMIIEKI